MADPRPDFVALRGLFPALHQEINGRPLVYLDNAASSHMPLPVLEALHRYHTREHSNVHRGVHTLSQLATTRYEGARQKVQQFIGASRTSEIVFTRGTTDAINLVAHGYGRKFLGAGDEVLITTMEHHSNIVPWQMVCAERGAILRVVPMSDAGELDMEAFARLLNPRTRIVACTHVSNALGTINPVARICRMAREVGAVSLIDGAQAIPHTRVDVEELGCDFYAFSGHKLYGPTGIGVLYGRQARLEEMQPYQGGGDMIVSVTFEKTTYAPPPAKFEAGTPPIVAAVGLGAAIDFLLEVGMDHIAAREEALLRYATEALEAIDGVRLVGTAREKASVLSFVLEGIHPHDIGSILDSEGVAVRAGHHCAQPVMDRLGVPATARASLAFYNTEADVDALVRGIHIVKEIFG